jgi:hypothetical protein
MGIVFSQACNAMDASGEQMPKASKATAIAKTVERNHEGPLPKLAAAGLFERFGLTLDSGSQNCRYEDGKEKKCSVDVEVYILQESGYCAAELKGTVAVGGNSGDKEIAWEIKPKGIAPAKLQFHETGGILPVSDHKQKPELHTLRRDKDNDKKFTAKHKREFDKSVVTYVPIVLFYRDGNPNSAPELCAVFDPKIVNE